MLSFQKSPDEQLDPVWMGNRPHVTHALKVFAVNARQHSVTSLATAKAGALDSAPLKKSVGTFRPLNTLNGVGS